MGADNILASVLSMLGNGAPGLFAYCVGICFAFRLRSRNPAGSLTAILALSVLLIAQILVIVAYAALPQLLKNDGGDEGMVGAFWLVGFIHSGVHGLGILALVGAVFQSRPNEAEVAADDWENSR